MAKKISTGIKGLDKCISGGLNEGDITLVAGAPGTGKSILGLQFLCEAPSEEFGVYLSFTSPKEDIIEQAKAFGWDIEKLEKEGKLKVICKMPIDMSSILTELEKLKTMPNRLVVDSITAAMNVKEQGRRDILPTIQKLKELKITSMFISEIPKEYTWFSRDTYMEFVADGIILLECESIGKEVSRTIKVVKLRKSKIDASMHNLEITKTGLKVS